MHTQNNFDSNEVDMTPRYSVNPTDLENQPGNKVLRYNKGISKVEIVNSVLDEEEETPMNDKFIYTKQ